MTGRGGRAALGLVLLLAALLRLPGLDRVPGPLHPDEAAAAADAREGTLALAYPREGDLGPGHDEGPYVWLAAPALAAGDAVGLPVEAAARLPAALAGLLLVAATFALGRDLAGPRAGALAALLVALEPWAVHFSRLALRGVLVPPLVAAGLLLLDRGGRRPCLGGALLPPTAATYPPARLVVPPLAAAWVALAPRGAPPLARRLAPLAPLAATFALLLPWTLAPDGGGARLAQVWAPHGEGLAPAAVALRGWAVHLGTRFLWSGATSRGFAPEGVPLLLRPEAALVALGLLALAARARRGERPAARPLVWLALFPAAAALTTDVPNAMRAVLGLPALALVGAVGADAALRRLPPRLRRPGLGLVVAAVAGAGLGAHARYARALPEVEARFYFAGRRELARALGARAAAGQALVVEAPFVEAYLRLYAPAAPRRREGGALVVGPGPATARVVLLDGRDGAPEVPRAGDAVLVPGLAVVRPRP